MDEDYKCMLCPVGNIWTKDLGSKKVTHIHDYCDGCSYFMCTKDVQARCSVETVWP